MSLPRYPAYKESGVEWLGEVPEHWALPKLKSVAAFCGGGTPNREIPAYWSGDIPWVSPKDMKSERIVGAEESITEEGLKRSASNLLPPGHVLMVVRSGILKHTIPIAINEAAVALNQDMKALNFDPARCLGRFFLRWVQGFNNPLLLAWAKQGATVESIEHAYLANTVIPLPDRTEQTAIAGFLDRETAKIDELIGEQRRLIELLKEKRQAVVSHAVTRGLNPHAPLKPSGVEWLGDVPEHWEIVPLKRLIAEGTSISYGIVQPGEPLAEGVPFVQTTNMTTGDFDLATLQKTSAEIAVAYPRSKLTGGEVILGIRASIGAAHVVPPQLEGANLSRGVARIVPNGQIASRYLTNYFGTVSVSRYWQLSKQGSTFNEVSIETVRELSVCVPPTEEQNALIRAVSEEARRFDTLTAEAERAIDLLQERRSALISAAVTGQIDVRGKGIAPDGVT